MKKYSPILDSEVKLKESGRDNELHMIIHFPEQLRSAYQCGRELNCRTFKTDQIYIIDPECKSYILKSWLLQLLPSKLNLTVSEALPSKDCKGLIIEKSDRNEIEKRKDLLNIFCRDDEGEMQTRIDFSKIPFFDDLIVIFGAICGIIESLLAHDLRNKINSLAALLMQKAGALTWRNPLSGNYAKYWAVKIFESGLHSVTSSKNNGYDLISRKWERDLRVKSVNAGTIRLFLTGLNDERMRHDERVDVICGDGKSRLEELVSLYQLGKVIAIFRAVLNNSREEV